jgi:hypothetical protein
MRAGYASSLACQEEGGDGRWIAKLTILDDPSCEVGFYHGGDVLYTLDGIPGLWHEQCLVGPD